MKVTYYVASTLDAFIADADGGVAFLDPYGDGDEDYGYGAFIASVDVLIMGRGTYRFVEEHGTWPYDLPTIVMTANAPDTSMAESIDFTSDSPEAVVTALSAAGHEHAWLVGGGELARSFLLAGYLHYVIVSIAPTVIGGGISLFGGAAYPLGLEFKSARGYDSGMVQIEYGVRAPAVGERPGRPGVDPSG